MNKPINPALISDDIELLESIMIDIKHLLEATHDYGLIYFEEISKSTTESIHDVMSQIESVREIDKEIPNFSEILKDINPDILTYSQVGDPLTWKTFDNLLCSNPQNVEVNKKMAKKQSSRSKYLSNEEKIVFHELLKQAQLARQPGKLMKVIAQSFGVSSKTAQRTIRDGPIRRMGAGRKIKAPDIEAKIQLFCSMCASTARPPSRPEVRILAGCYKAEMTGKLNLDPSKVNAIKSSKGWIDKFIKRHPDVKILNYNDPIVFQYPLLDMLKTLGMDQEYEWFSSLNYQNNEDKENSISVKKEEPYLTDDSKENEEQLKVPKAKDNSITLSDVKSEFDVDMYFDLDSKHEDLNDSGTRDSIFHSSFNGL